MKSKFYVATRNPSRTAKSEIKVAIDAFMASGHGEYDGDMVVGHAVINFLLEKGITFELTHLGETAVLRRVRA